MDEKIKKEREWYDNPNIIITISIAVLSLIIILSQSYLLMIY